MRARADMNDVNLHYFLRPDHHDLGRIWAATSAMDDAGFAVACVRGLRAGCAPWIEATPEALTQGDIRRVLPAADAAILDRIFRRADGAKFGAPSDASLQAEKPALLALLAELEARL